MGRRVRGGAVCPFVPGSLERRTLWLAAEHVAGTALYNPDFRPFQPPVPFLFVRHTVLSDWKFFLDDDASLDRWARRFGPSATAALAEQLRRLPWRTPNNAA